MQISPGEIYAIRRQLDDPLDVSTWYVRAVLTWADTDVIIPINGLNYVNLTDQGSQLFRTNITVPPDKNGGNGSRIAIKTTVYSDSGYTFIGCRMKEGGMETVSSLDDARIKRHKMNDAPNVGKMTVADFNALKRESGKFK